MADFEMLFFFLAQMFVVSICFNFVRIFQILLSEEAVIKEVITPTLFAGVQIIYMFLSNFMGQNMTDYNNFVFATVYRVEWYVTPLHIQKMLLFLLLKGAKNYTLNIGGLFTTSLECFATLVKASVSYFTFILSTQ
ncbi:PREDICTED: odorant receptor 49b-like [Wasmannia auropunctata]|uniref:odorant receptor 49b-like n=1 Tax=Wasmannia auropunctata TaxID=64793 RepID=UPI0005F00974|nr:PREDICTED: odorant receptor 49b-like [Wasmannia auropunctata]